MAHELEFVDGEASMAFTGSRDAIWHRLGYQVPDDISPMEMMDVSKLNWVVNKVPAYVELFDRVSDDMSMGRKVQTGMSALVRDRDNKILSMVSNEWEPIQNVEIFQFFEDFINNADMKMDTCGSLKGGQLIWALAKIKEGFKVHGGDEIRGFMLLTGSHQYGRTSDVRFVQERVVCQNTLTIALNEDSKQAVKVHHRKKFNAEEVKDMMGISHNKMDSYKAMAEHLGTIRYTEDSLKEYFKNVFPITSEKKDKNVLSLNAKRALEIINTQPGHEFAEGTMWQAFNAVTYLNSNVLGRDDETRMYNNFYGSNRQVNINALNLALAA